MNNSSNYETDGVEDDVIDLTQDDDDDDDDDVCDDGVGARRGTKRCGSIHAYNTRSTRTRAIKLEDEGNNDKNNDEVGGNQPPLVVTPDKYVNRTITDTDKCCKITPTDSYPEDGQDSDTTSHGVHRSSNELGEEDKDVDGKEEEDATAGLESEDDNASIFNDDSEVDDEEKESADVESDDNASIFNDESEDDENEEKAGEESNDDISLFGNSDEDDCSRFSGGGDDQWIAENTPEEVPPRRQEKIKSKKRTSKKDTSKFLATSFHAPPDERFEPECYYFAQLVEQLGRHMRKKTTTMSDGLPLRILDDRQEERFEIVYSEVVKRKSNGAKEDRMGAKYYKSFYFGLGKKEDESSLNSFLSTIADFESLTYKKGAHKAVSRLKLLFSGSCRLPGRMDKFCFYWLPKKDVKVIEDDGHLGCGFIDPKYLSDLTGKLPTDVFAVQVRIFGPSSIGIAKGMLVIKEGLAGHKVQIPKSMIKVEKSKANEPAHTNVALSIIRVFPSEKNKIMGRLFDDRKKDPTPPMIRSLEKPPGDSILNVLRCKGVDENRIENYINILLQATKDGDITQARAAIKHGSLVGLSDPTGYIPRGMVFLTGFGELAPSHTFITRSPCTEGKDGIIAKVASWRDIRSKEAFQFLNELPYGGIFFPLGEDPLPPKINSSDLDGDLYQCIWDSILIEGVQFDDEDTNLGKIVYDELVGTEFQHEYEGKAHASQVVKWLGGDLYLVATGPLQRVMVEMTKEQITEGRDFIVEVVAFRAKGSSKLGQFKCKWSSGGSEWISLQSLRKDFGGSPPHKLKEYVLDNKKQLLLEGVLPKNFSKWLDKNIDQSELVEIINHRKKGKNTEVQCEYDDGSKLWIDLELQKRDSKIFVGAYAKKKNLFGRPGWNDVENFWLDEVQYLMCNNNRSMVLSNLTPSLFSFWKKSFKELGPFHDDTAIWGRAYKESNDIEKHGVVPKLPLHLHRKLSKTLIKYVEMSEGDTE